jgi:hypothetical protein
MDMLTDLVQWAEHLSVTLCLFAYLVLWVEYLPTMQEVEEYPLHSTNICVHYKSVCIASGCFLFIIMCVFNKNM